MVIERYKYNRKLAQLKARVDRTWATFETLQRRHGVPNELLDEAQDQWTTAANDLWAYEGTQL